MGGLAGIVMGLIGFAICRFAASTVERNPVMKNREKVAHILRTAGLAVLIADTLVGYLFLGPVVADILGSGGPV